MNIYRAIVPLLFLGSTIAAEKTDKPGIKAELDSIECHFAPQENQPPCTIRIHFLPKKGICITPGKSGDAPHAPLQCVDETGNLLLGTVREWEHCYDGNEECHTAVYDFFTAPKGGSITVDTHIPVPITREQDKADIVPFSPYEHKQIEVAGHLLTIEPIDATPEAKRAAQIAFRIIYDHPDTKKRLHLCTSSGEPIQYRAKVENDNQAQDTCVSYILHSDKKAVQLAIAPIPTTTLEQVPVRFRASLGTLDEKLTPSSSSAK